jgi:hypothetical protein
MRDSLVLGLATCLCFVSPACGGGSFSSNGGEAGFNSGGDGTGGDGTGGTGTGGTGTGGRIVAGTPIPLANYSAAVGEMLCPPFGTCCTALGIPLTVAQCQTTLLGVSTSYETADPANYTYDPVAAGTCLATAQEAIPASGCNTDAMGTDPLCNNVFTGLLAPGQPCTDDIECRQAVGEDVACEAVTTGAVNVCVLRLRVTAGQPCYWTCTEQAGGLRLCSGAGPNKTEVQGRCFTNDGVYCSSDGLCMPQGKIGDVCSLSQSCGEGFCDTASGLCTTRALAGGACVGDVGCAEGLYCKTQLCTPELAPGSPCAITDQCKSGNCTNGLCVANPPVNPDQIGMAFLCAILSGGLQQ